MKILLLTKTLTKGGAASGARNLIGALTSAGGTVVALDAYGVGCNRLKRIFRTGERMLERVFWDAETHCMRLAPPTFDLKSLYTQLRPDIIQLCDISGNTIAFSDIQHVPCPVVHRMSDFWPYHGARHYAARIPANLDLADRFLRLMIHDGSSMPDCRVAPSHWLARQLSSRSIRVILNAVRTPDGIEPRTLNSGLLRLGFISGSVMDPRKGFSALIQVLDAVARQQSRSLELHIFGRFPKDPNFAFSELKAVFHPPFTSDILRDVYETFDILLCPSVRDNSPNVVTEAFAHGVPVIAQSGTGMDSYVQSETGALIDFHGNRKGAVSDLCTALQRVATNYQHYSSAALAYARDQLSPKVIGSQYLALYEQLLNNPLIGRS